MNKELERNLHYLYIESLLAFFEKKELSDKYFFYGSIDTVDLAVFHGEHGRINKVLLLFHLRVNGMRLSPEKLL